MKSIKSIYKGVVPRIGLEVHAQLKLPTKLFSQADVCALAKPNSQLDLFDISSPGTLPKLSKKAIDAAIITCLGLNCSIQNYFHFDRKHYFYSDMPAGFQLTQYHNPIAKGGYIDFIVRPHHKSLVAHSQNYDLVKYLYSDDRLLVEEYEPYMKRSCIKQVQLEQDSAKTLYFDEKFSLIDYNRCGSALLEIVFEPDLENHLEAASVIKQLVLNLKQLKTCNCELEEGSMRVDANVSIEKISGEPVNQSGRVELKNLNSLKSLSKGISHEIQRQAALIVDGQIIRQESRAFETKSGRTIPLRLKEEVVDYRYVPEPSIPPVTLSSQYIERIRKELPALMPTQMLQSLLSDYKLDMYLVMEVLEEPGLYQYLTCVVENTSYDINVFADFLVYSMANLKLVRNSPIQVELANDSEFVMRLNPGKMRKIFDMMIEDEISFAIAYEIIKHIFISNDETSPREIVEKFKWNQINDSELVLGWCKVAISKRKDAAKKYSKKGEKRHLRLLLDKLCELTDNRISMHKATEVLDALLRPPEQRN